MDRRELAAFLRSRRERLAPAAVGLPAGPRRRTPGLRREEAARLAHISIEYYTQLEQARGPRPSPEVLAGIARALRLSDAERDHLHHLAGTPPGPAPEPPREVRQGVLALIERLTHAAAIVTSATFEVLAWNDLAAALIEDFAPLDRRDRNLVRRYFLGSVGTYRGAESKAESDVDSPIASDPFALSSVRELRAVAARYPASVEVAELVRDLLAGSPEFARLWDSHEVEPRPPLQKSFDHPVAGRITVDCDVLDIANRDQRVVIYTAAPGSPSEEALRLLSALGPLRAESPAQS